MKFKLDILKRTKWCVIPWEQTDAFVEFAEENGVLPLGGAVFFKGESYEEDGTMHIAEETMKGFYIH